MAVRVLDGGEGDLLAVDQDMRGSVQVDRDGERGRVADEVRRVVLGLHHRRREVVFGRWCVLHSLSFMVF